MTPQEFMAQVELRLRDDEGCRLYKYRDSRGITTIADGFNLQRGDAANIFRALGINWATVAAAPVAIDSAPQNAVAPCITQAQADALFGYDVPNYVAAARGSLAPGVFDALTDARRFVIIDLCYNMGTGQDGWGGFGATRALIAEATQAKTAGKLDLAHALYAKVGDHLEASAWFGQVGNRARRDVAMMRAGVFCSPTGDGSDVL